MIIYNSVQLTMERKFKVSLRKVMKIHGEGSGAVSELNTTIQDKKWKSAWLVLQPYMVLCSPCLLEVDKIKQAPSAITSHADNVNLT